MKPAYRIAASCALGAASGLLLWLVPDAGFPSRQIALLFVVGFVLGATVRSPYSVIAAICVMGGFVLVIPIDLLRDPTSHNLLGIELGLYAVGTIVALIGTVPAAFLRERIVGWCRKA